MRNELIPPLLGYYTMAGGAAPVATPWYLTGGIPSANCIAAYQPKGAADYATSKVNLANPGTYNAADGVAYPTWDDTNGWKFLATSSQYLSTGIYVNTGWSFVVRVTNQAATNGYIFGSYDGAGRVFGINPGKGDGSIIFALGGERAVAGAGAASGVFLAANQLLYKDGTQTGLASSNWSGLVSPDDVKVGTYELGNSSYHKTGYVQALAIYDTDITSYVAALTAAVAAL